MFEYILLLKLNFLIQSYLDIYLAFVCILYQFNLVYFLSRLNDFYVKSFIRDLTPRLHHDHDNFFHDFFSAIVYRDGHDSTIDSNKCPFPNLSYD